MQNAAAAMQLRKRVVPRRDGLVVATEIRLEQAPRIQRDDDALRLDQKIKDIEIVRAEGVGYGPEQREAAMRAALASVASAVAGFVPAKAA